MEGGGLKGYGDVKTVGSNFWAVTTDKDFPPSLPKGKEVEHTAASIPQYVKSAPATNTKAWLLAGKAQKASGSSAQRPKA